MLDSGKKSLLLFPSRNGIQASSSQAMPTHIDYSSESEEEEMTPSKGSHISCGSSGGEAKLSLCCSYRRAVGSVSGWPSAVVESTENHSLSQDLIQGQKPFSLQPWYLCPSAMWSFIKTLPMPQTTYQLFMKLWQLDCHSALPCHLAKPGRLHFLNCSSETKLAQPLLIILVILPLNCLHFVSLFLAVT